MSAIQAAIDQVRRGVPSHEVISELRKTYTTEHTISDAVSQVRCAILDSHTPIDAYDPSCLVLLRFVQCKDKAESNAISAFLDAPLREQLRLQREHKADPTWSDACEHALAALRIFPDDFGLPREDSLRLKRKREEAQLKRNAALLVVPDFTALLKAATDMLHRATPHVAYSRLILPLLLVSGRRLTEICSPRSTFAPLPHSQYAAAFTGALKKRGHTPTCTIPLLVPFNLFSAAIAALRQKQGANMVSTLSNKQLKNRYQWNTQNGLAKGALPGMPQCHIHDLRATYAAACFTLFQSPHSLAYTTMTVLCHEHLEESLSYGHVRLEKVDEQHSLGPLPCQIT